MTTEMTTKRSLRIGGASGFWGDSSTGPMQLAKLGDLDFMVFDYLAELTMSILAAQRAKNPDAGFALDFVTVAMRGIAADVAQGKFRVICNAGGVNPQACARALQALCNELGITLSIAVVDGDDVMPNIDAIRSLGVSEMNTGLGLPTKLVTANAYLGAWPIKAALDAGAQVVITGRCVDSAVTLGALLHHFDWSTHDLDQLAQGSLAGHIVECGCQATGGLFTDWDSVPNWANMGYPILECFDDSSFIVSKCDGTGGLINTAVIAEQIVYEIGDPKRYILPDVICDFSNLSLQDLGNNTVRVSGARGLLPPQQLKVCATYLAGYRSTAQLTIIGFDAPLKAKRTAQAILDRTRMLFEQYGYTDYTRTNIEILGSESAYGPHGALALPKPPCREVVMHLVVAHSNRMALEIFCREIAAAGTSFSPGTTGAGGGRPSVSPSICQYSFLLDRSFAQAQISMYQDGVIKAIEYVDPNGLFNAAQDDQYSNQFNQAMSRSIDIPTNRDSAGDDLVELPLLAIAHARSGDKGDTSNIGVIARSEAAWVWMQQHLLAQQVQQYLAYLVKGTVTRYELAGIRALNFVCTQALDGGGMASMRNDALGKGMAQLLLAMPIRVPAVIAATCQR